jgi:hypothetical protein
MSATPSTTNPLEPIYPERTQADQDAIFASVVWVHAQRSAGKLKPYEGGYIAVLGEKIIDSDKDDEALGRRLEARRETLPINRVVLQYVHKPEDWNWK